MSLDVDTGNPPLQPSVTPPASPMRKRSLDIEKEKLERPKPTVRRRKKFQTPGEEAQRASGVDEHDGEGERTGEHSAVVVESHDQVVESHEDKVVESHDKAIESHDQHMNGEVPVEQSSLDDDGGLEKSGEGEGESTNQNKENRFGDGSGDGWEMISDVPNISISADAEKNQTTEPTSKSNTLKKQKSEEVTPTQSPTLSTANKMTKKKRPPPFRPAPYNSATRTPPIPPKQRKHVYSQLAAEAKKIVRPDGQSPESTPEPEEHRPQIQQQQQEEGREDDHVYEVVDPFHAPTPLRLVENGHGFGRTKYLGSSSSDTSVSPSQTLSRSTSISNSECIISGDPAGLKHSSGTFSLSNLRSVAVRGDSGKKTRPHSEAPNTSVRDFETSFEVHVCVCVCGVCVAQL